MKTIKNIFISVVIFGLCYVFEKILFGIIYYVILGTTSNTFTQTINLSILGTITDLCEENIYLTISFVVQSIIELIMFSVFTSYVFAYLLNREPKIVFPEKLLLRRRTSEGSDGIVYLCIMIGNRSKIKIRNVACTLSCSYIKDNDSNKINSEFNFTMFQPCIDNYYRFSCMIDELPKLMIKHYFENNELGLKHDTIKITLSGNMNTFGNNFLVEKKYKISDIVIGENYVGLELKRFSKNKIINKMVHNYSIDWKKLNMIKPMIKEERQSIINELCDLCKE